jgi:aspartyl-tRNA(Asn)/glutamyl-tRNA(Gln) amidotransferase subunit C
MDDKKTVKNLAELARIDISDEEAASFQGDFKNILAYVDQIASLEVDLDGDAGRNPVVNVLREDVDPYESGEFSKEILDNAPESQEEYIKVQKILSSNE